MFVYLVVSKDEDEDDETIRTYPNKSRVLSSLADMLTSTSIQLESIHEVNTTQGTIKTLVPVLDGMRLDLKERGTA